MCFKRANMLFARANIIMVWVYSVCSPVPQSGNKEVYFKQSIRLSHLTKHQWEWKHTMNRRLLHKSSTQTNQPRKKPIKIMKKLHDNCRNCRRHTESIFKIHFNLTLMLVFTWTYIFHPRWTIYIISSKSIFWFHNNWFGCEAINRCVHVWLFANVESRGITHIWLKKTLRIDCTIALNRWH